MPHFIITGNRPLTGQITVNASKNAAVAILIGSLINHGTTTLKNVPAIEEISRLLEVLASIGVKITRRGKILIIQPPIKFALKKINRESAEKTRSIILLLGALACQLKNFNIPAAGGCRLGSRTIMPHLYALESFGLNVKATSSQYRAESKKLQAAELVLYESSDTVTENTLLLAAQIPSRSVIKFATANYMVQDLCFFLEKLGVKITGIGTSTIEIIGQKNINKNISYAISEDPIEAMLFLASAVVTNSELTVKRCPIDFLSLELLKLEKMGLHYKLSQPYYSFNGRTKLVNVTVYPSKLTALSDKIHALPYPGINQDNLPFFVPIATQAKGETLIHDWAYENRAIYFTELAKLGANINLIDNHRVTVIGPTKLKAAEIICPPALRPAAIILVAMLAAKGQSILRNVYPIARGYESLATRLASLGADIKLVDE